MVRAVKILFFLIICVFLGFSSLRAAAPAPSWLLYGHNLYQHQRYAEALTAYQNAAQKDPNDAAAQQGIGNALLQLGRQAEALQAYDKSLALKPDNAALKAYVDQIRAQVPVVAETTEDLEEPLSDGRGLLEQHRFEEALKLYQAEPAGATKSSAWQQGKAEAYYGLGRMEDARVAMRAAVKLDAGNREARDQLQRYLGPETASDGGGSDWFAPLWRSALIPGWGQNYNGQKHKALVLGGLTWGLLAGTLATYAAAGSALDDYQKLGPGTSAGDFDSAFAKADNYALVNEAFGLLFYTAYAYNVFDAAAQARPAVQAELRGKSPVLAWHQEF